MTKKVTVVARLKAKPGMEETLKQELLALVPPTVQERGCLNYDLHQSAEDPALFLFYENWISKQDLDEHLETPHLQAFFAKTDRLLVQPPSITLWKMLD